MAVVNKFNVNKEQVTLGADIIENMSANDVSYNDSIQYDENTVGNKLSELKSEVIYDVTANNDGVTFSSLSALLSDENLSTLIPVSVRCGGMSIRFVQSSDNKYIQYRLMSDAFSTTEGDWQGVDDVPVAGSNNLIKSGGVYEKTKGISTETLPFDTSDDSIQFQDNLGNVIHEFTNEYTNLKNVKSNGKDVATKDELNDKQDKIEEISETSTLEDDDSIQFQDDNGNLICEVNEDGIKVKSITDLNDNPISGEKYKFEGTIDVNYNSAAIAPFLLKYVTKDVDVFGQLTIHLCGDSIFGRQDKGVSWNPVNPEMSLTPDMNDPNEAQPGYITGHFPPNAWEQLVGYRLIKALQYNNAEVKYYNHVATEVTKIGTWNDLFPAGIDSLRLCSNVTNGDSISLTFSGAKYAKIIVSNYYGNTSYATIKVEVSDDSGTTFKTPTEASLTESRVNSGVSGEYSLVDTATIKFAELCWAGFDENKTYILRVTHTNSSLLRVWGFETWNNARINIINCAEGANTAASQNRNPKRFYNSYSKPSLVIYELPYLNDLGTGAVPTNKYGGFITTSSSPTQTPSDGYTYCCNETGIYNNFGGIKAYKYEYLSYDATNVRWIKGSLLIDEVMREYKKQCELSLKNIKHIGIPIIAIITHNSNSYGESRRFMLHDGLNILRALTKKYGYATIDLNAYQMSLPDPKILTDAPADNTHLNDNGSALYAEMITEVIKSDMPNSIGASNWENGSFYGEGNPGDVTFDGNIELSTIPKISILDNPSITISNITNTGFTATGNGSFTYKTIVKN